MKVDTFISLLCVLMTVIRCSPKVEVIHDYDPDIDFIAYRTYSWMEGRAVNPDDVLSGTIDARTVQNAVDAALASKGYSFAEEGMPDLIVIVHAGVENRIFVDDYGYTAGDWWGYAQRNMEVSRYEEGTLFVDFIDADEKILVWRGAATVVIDEIRDHGKRTEKLTDYVTMILEEFPPE